MHFNISISTNEIFRMCKRVYLREMKDRTILNLRMNENFFFFIIVFKGFVFFRVTKSFISYGLSTKLIL
ncbi:hypothetical protein PGB90_003476 [Kerria lacca]